MIQIWALFMLQSVYQGITKNKPLLARDISLGSVEVHEDVGGLLV